MEIDKKQPIDHRLNNDPHFYTWMLFWLSIAFFFAGVLVGGIYYSEKVNEVARQTIIEIKESYGETCGYGFFDYEMNQELKDILSTYNISGNNT